MNRFVTYTWVVLLSFAAGFFVGRGGRHRATETLPHPAPDDGVLVYCDDRSVDVYLSPHCVHVDGRPLLRREPPPGVPVWTVAFGNRLVVAGTAVSR